MSTVLVDSFTATDGTTITSRLPDLGAAWVQLSTGQYTIYNGRAVPTAANIVYNETSTSTPDQIVEFDYTYFTGTTAAPGICWRKAAGSTQTFYMLRLEGVNVWQFYQCLAGTFTLINSWNHPSTPASGTTWRVRVESIGNVHSFYLDDILTQTYTDSAITTGLLIGFRHNVNGTSSTAKHFDNVKLIDPIVPDARPNMPALNRKRAQNYGSRSRLWLVDRYGNRQEEIPLAASTVSAAITCNEDSSPIRQLSIDVAQAGKLRPFRDYVQPELALSSPGGAVDVHPQGVMLVTGRRRDARPARIAETLAAADLSWHLDHTRIGTIVFPVGTDTGVGMRVVASFAGFVGSSIAIPDTGVELTTEMRPPPGSTCREVLTMLANAGSWYSPWFDYRGVLVTRAWGDLTSSPPNASYGHGSDIKIVGSIASEPDYTRLRNTVRVRKNASDPLESFMATARITNPEHPLFYDPADLDAGIGYEISDPPYDEPDLVDLAHAQQLAEARLSQRASYYEPIRISTIADLHADVHDIVELGFKTPRLSIYAGRWWRRAWTMRIRGVTALTEHDLYRVEEWK